MKSYRDPDSKKSQDINHSGLDSPPESPVTKLDHVLVRRCRLHLYAKLQNRFDEEIAANLYLGMTLFLTQQADKLAKDSVARRQDGTLYPLSTPMSSLGSLGTGGMCGVVDVVLPIISGRRYM
jgi:hypothetical protein